MRQKRLGAAIMRKPNFWSIGTTLAILISWFSVSETSAARTDLLTLLNASETVDPLYLEAQASALSVAEGIPQAKADLWLPTLSLSAGTARLRQDIELGTQFGTGGEISFQTNWICLN